MAEALLPDQRGYQTLAVVAAAAVAAGVEMVLQV